VAGGFAMGSVAETDLAMWRKMFDINLNSAFLCTRAALSHMDPARDGRIVNVGAFAARSAPTGLGAYTAAKAGVLQLTEVVAEETLTTRITVNAVLPTIMDTPGNRQAMPDAAFNRWVPVVDAARTILFLADAANWHITGACLPLRGHC
jgi:NAD(P)-dependent dehydrogenase (short-subunit alcohol dehydrogenase family)